jgi:protein SCO1/2
VSRYLYGIEYQPRNLRLALVEAADGKIGTPVDKALLYCYHYDPETGKYGLAIMNLVRLGGIATVAGVASFILFNLRRRPQPPAVMTTATDKR